MPVERFCRRILGMLSLTVETADNLLANSRLFGGINSVTMRSANPANSLPVNCRSASSW